MKKVITLLLFIFISLSLTARTGRINGLFKVAHYERHYGIQTYFEGVNNTHHPLTIWVHYSNDQEGKYHFFKTTIDPGESFIIGPENKWYWHPDERIFVEYEDNKKDEWVYAKTGKSSRSFMGQTGKKCTYDHRKCSCSGWKQQSKGGVYCANCGHPKVHHKD